MPTFTGTPDNDTLAGSLGADLLRGLAGDDTYIINNRGDRVEEAADAGDDLIVTSVLDVEGTFSLAVFGHVEGMRYAGAALTTTLIGNSLSNVIKANAALSAADILWGGAGNDTVFGYAGNDLLFGGSGNDWLDGGTGADRLAGGAGNDTYVIDSAADRIAEGAGDGIDTVLSAISFSLDRDWSAEVERLIYTGTVAAVLKGNDLDNVIVSQGAAADTLFGGAGNDRLDGGADNDRLVGGTGDDTYVLDTGDVVIELAGEGRDTFIGTVTSIGDASELAIENLIHTGTGAAALFGNSLDNVVAGGVGANTVSGLDGDDTLAGDTGADRLFGGNGADWLFGGSIPLLTIGADRVNDTSADSLEGGEGDDVYFVSDTLDVIVELADGGRDTVLSSVSNRLSRYANVEALLLDDGSGAVVAAGSIRNDMLMGNDRDNVVDGGTGDDTISGWGFATGSDVADVLRGGSGNDVLVALNPGSAAIAAQVDADGGTGNDLYIVGDGVLISGGDAGGADAAVVFGQGSIVALGGVEVIHLFGAGGSLDIAAMAALAQMQVVLGSVSAYDPAVSGYGTAATGNDLGNAIYGNMLGNTLSGGGGNDSLFGGNGNDLLIGGAGIDTLAGGRGDDTYDAHLGDIVVEVAGLGVDVIRSATITSLAGYANIEGLLYTGGANVTLSGEGGDDIRGGGRGDDRLAGFGGQDQLFGGEGNDLLFGGTGNDRLDAGAGDDTSQGGDGADAINGDAGNDDMAGDLGDDQMDGGAGHDLMDGGGNFDTLYGQAGNDTMSGGDGADALYGGTGNDVLFSGIQDDFVFGGQGHDTIYLDAGDNLGDVVFGDDPGGFGADQFVADTVTIVNGLSETFNGSGQFHFKSAATIHDFQSGLDRFFVAKELVGNLDSTVDNPAEVFGSGAAFDATAEIVFFRSDLAETLYVAGDRFGPLNEAPVSDVIGDATAAFAIGSTRLFVLDDGANAAVFLFQSNDGNAVVTADELYLLAVTLGTGELTLDDLFLV